MWGAAETFVRVVDEANYRIGRLTMYLLFAMVGILFWSIFTKAFLLPSLWTLQASQFTMAAFYVLGGAYSLQMGSHVRMDLLYGSWSPRTRAAMDAVTVLALIFFLCVLLYGGFSSTAYALEYGERSRAAWRAHLAPIKIIMCVGIVMMILQSLVCLIRDVALLKDRELPPSRGAIEAMEQAERDAAQGVEDPAAGSRAR